MRPSPNSSAAAWTASLSCSRRPGTGRAPAPRSKRPPWRCPRRPRHRAAGLWHRWLRRYERADRLLYRRRPKGCPHGRGLTAGGPSPVGGGPTRRTPALVARPPQHPHRGDPPPPVGGWPYGAAAAINAGKRPDGGEGPPLFAGRALRWWCGPGTGGGPHGRPREPVWSVDGVVQVVQLLGGVDGRVAVLVAGGYLDAAVGHQVSRSGTVTETGGDGGKPAHGMGHAEPVHEVAHVHDLAAADAHHQKTGKPDRPSPPPTPLTAGRSPLSWHWRTRSTTGAASSCPSATPTLFSSARATPTAPPTQRATARPENWPCMRPGTRPAASSRPQPISRPAAPPDPGRHADGGRGARTGNRPARCDLHHWQ